MIVLGLVVCSVVCVETFVTVVRGVVKIRISPRVSQVLGLSQHGPNVTIPILDSTYFFGIGNLELFKGLKYACNKLFIVVLLITKVFFTRFVYFRNNLFIAILLFTKEFFIRFEYFRNFFFIVVFLFTKDLFTCFECFLNFLCG